MPRIAFDSLKDPQVVDHFSLEIQGLEHGTFREADGIESSNDVIETREMGLGGKQYVTKLPGNLKWGDITLKRGVTDSMELYKWRQAVIDGNMAEARKSGSIILYNAMNEAIGRYDFVRAWPSKYKGPGVNATNNAIASEEITLAHEGLTRSS